MGRKSTGFQAKTLLIRSVKHILQAAEDFKNFGTLVVEHHPEWKDDMLIVGVGIATLYEAMCGIYERFWGPIPEEWDTHH